MHIPLINGNNDLEVSSVICKVTYVSMVSNIPEARIIVFCSFQMVRSLLYFTRLTNWHLGKGFEFQTWTVQKTGLLIWCAPKIWYWTLQVNSCAIKPTWQVVQDLHWSWKLFCLSEYSFDMRMPILISLPTLVSLFVLSFCCGFKGIMLLVNHRSKPELQLSTNSQTSQDWWDRQMLGICNGGPESC